MRSKVYVAVVVILTIAIVGVMGAIIFLWTHPREVRKVLVDEEGKAVSEEDVMQERAWEIYPEVYQYLQENGVPGASDEYAYTNADYFVNNSDVPEGTKVDSFSPNVSYILDEMFDDYDSANYKLLNVELAQDDNDAYELRHYIMLDVNDVTLFYVVIENIDCTYANVLPYASRDEGIKTIQKIMKR